jgi:hypothetical protein
MSALDRLKINEHFVNFDDVLNFVERLTTEHFMPLRITDSKTIEKYNESLKCEESYLDSNLKFHHAKFVCSHFGEHRSRSNGKRSNQYMRACKFHFCLLFLMFANRMIFESNLFFPSILIMLCLRQLLIHFVGRSKFLLFFLLMKNLLLSFLIFRRLNCDVSDFIENSLFAGAQPTLIRKRAFVQFGKDIPAKSIQNMHQKIAG